MARIEKQIRSGKEALPATERVVVGEADAWLNSAVAAVDSAFGSSSPQSCHYRETMAAECAKVNRWIEKGRQSSHGDWTVNLIGTAIGLLAEYRYYPESRGGKKLESAILKAIARARTDDWLPCSIGDLRNRMREIDTDAADASINSIAEAIIFLAQEGYLLLGKREHGGKRLPFDFQKQLDEGYIANFFGRDSFELKLTHQERSRVGESGRNTPADEPQDHGFARLAIEEARKSVPENDGRPHPMVGAVVVKNGNVLATAHRGEAKGNHAEYIALEKRLADAAVAGATVYTTLEPCTTRNHPKIPCVERLIERKVRRVVIGMLDPDPRITGRGQRRLRSANIITDFFPHDLMAEVEELNREVTRKFESASRVADSPPLEVEPQAVGTRHRTTDVADKWVSLGYEHKSGVAKKLDQQGFDLGWVSADKEAEKIGFEGWDYVLVDQPDSKRARLKIRDHPAVGGYLVLLKRRRPSK